MNILYVHGFGSKFDPMSEKVKELEKIGTVFGIDIDWTLPWTECRKRIFECVIKFDIDLCVGTSMGGYGVAAVGTDCGIPYVALNPSTTPSKTLKRYVGTHTDYTGATYVLTDEVVDAYEPMQCGGYGLIIVDLGDDVIEAKNTVNMYKHCAKVVFFDGGSHRFEHMAEALIHIKEFYRQSETSYGVDNV